MLGELVGAKGARKKGQGQSQNRKQHFSAGCSTLSPLLLLLRRLVLVAAMGMYARHSRSFLQKWGFHILSFVRISDLHISARCAPTKSRTRTASTPSPSLSTYIRQAASCGSTLFPSSPSSPMTMEQTSLLTGLLSTWRLGVRKLGRRQPA